MSHLFSAAARRALRFSISSRTASKSSLFSPSLIHPRLAAAATADTTALRTFASKPRASGDERLQRVLQAEILHAESLGEVDKKTLVPKDFPFEIVDNSGEQMITLKRNVSGENIVVEAYMPDMNEEDEEEDDDGSDVDGGKDANVDADADGGKDANVDADADLIYVPLTVKIEKGEDTYLEFTCTASSKGIAIESMSLKSHQASPDAQSYEGPQYGDLDEALQQAAHTYLEDRGIDGSLSDFLEKYMIHKDDREYRDWLKNIKDFVTK